MSILSKDIIIFPCVSRLYTADETNIKAKLMSEENLTNILKSVTDKKSYIISYESKSIKFVLNGYYVELGNISLSEYTDPIYAVLNYQGSTGEHKIIVGDTGSDDKATFGGITLVTSTPDANSEYLCLWNGNSVPKESLCKFSANSLSLEGTTMDFGELN